MQFSIPGALEVPLNKDSMTVAYCKVVVSALGNVEVVVLR